MNDGLGASFGTDCEWKLVSASEAAAVDGIGAKVRQRDGAHGLKQIPSEKRAQTFSNDSRRPSSFKFGTRGALSHQGAMNLLMTTLAASRAICDDTAA